MLKSDNISRAHFLEMWRNAMWEAHGDLHERARLTMELGRAMVREDRSADPMVVAVVEDRDPPLVMLPMIEVPSHANPKRRLALQHRLAEIGAREVYVLMTVPSGSKDGVPSYLLVVYGERAGGKQVNVMAPFRWTPKGLEEAEMLFAPDPALTIFGKELAGLLLPRH